MTLRPRCPLPNESGGPCNRRTDREGRCPEHGGGKEATAPLCPLDGLTVMEPWEMVLRRTPFSRWGIDEIGGDMERVERVWKGTWKELEATTANLLRQGGCTLLQNRGHSGDGGIDTAAITPSGRLVALQCKHYAHPVKADVIKVFHYDTTRGWEDTTVYRKHPQPPAIRIVVTTSEFDPSAIQVAEREGIYLVNSRRLAAWLAFDVCLSRILDISGW